MRYQEQDKSKELARARRYYIDDFLNYLSVEKNLSSRTIDEYEKDLIIFIKYFKPHFEQELTLETIDERTIREFLTYLKRKKNYSPAALNRKIACLKSYFLFLENEGYIEKSPMKNVHSAKANKLLPKVLTVKDVLHLLKAVDSEPNEKMRVRDRAILELFYASGIRIGEMVKLDIDSVDLESLTLKVTGKGNKQRIVLLNNASKKAIEDYLRQRPVSHDAALFLNRFKKRLSIRGIENIFSKYLKWAGINKSACPHTLRHSFATHMLEGGSDLMTIKELLGHKNLSTTQIYTNISLKHMRDTYQKSHPRDNIAEDKE